MSPALGTPRGGGRLLLLRREPCPTHPLGISCCLCQADPGRPRPLVVDSLRSLSSIQSSSEYAGCWSASPHAAFEWGLRNFDYFALTALGAGRRASSAASMATVVLKLLCHGGYKASLGGSQSRQDSPWEGRPSLLYPGAPYIYLRHLFYTLNAQHSGGTASRDLQPTSTFSSCFGTAHTVRIALTFLSAQK